MKIIISGGLGYVGGRLSKYLAELGHEVVALSRQANTLPSLSLPAGMTVQHPDWFTATPERLKNFDAFIHLAALNEHDCVKFPEKAIEVNITHTLQWLDRAHRAGINQFIYFSTAHVYGKPLQGKYTETSLPTPVHPYAITHKAAEDYVLSYIPEKSMNNVVIRLTNSFGPPAFPSANRWTLLVNDLCRTAVKNASMILHSDGLQYRDFVCLEDVCTALHVLLQQPSSRAGIYHLGAGEAMTVWDMATCIHVAAESILGKQISVQRQKPGDKPIPSLHISVEKLKTLRWQPRHNITKEIEGTLRYFQSYPA